MSMMYWLVGLTSDQIALVRGAPNLASDICNVTVLEHYRAERPVRRDGSAGDAMAALDALGQASLSRLGRFGSRERALRLDKAWHILHYLLTGNFGDGQGPGDILMTGEEVGDDIGYGPARVHDEMATKQFALFLTAMTLDQLLVRLDWQKIAEMQLIYPFGGIRVGPEEERSWQAEIGERFVELKAYVAQMAGKGNGLMTWLS